MPLPVSMYLYAVAAMMMFGGHTYVAAYVVLGLGIAFEVGRFFADGLDASDPYAGLTAEQRAEIDKAIDLEEASSGHR